MDTPDQPIDANGYRIRLHPFYWIADCLSSLPPPPSKACTAKGNDRTPRPPTPWEGNGVIRRSIPVVRRKGTSTPLLVGERGLFLLAQEHDLKIIIDRRPSKKSAEKDALYYLASVVWDVLFSPVPPCAASLVPTFRMHAINFLENPDNREPLIEALYQENELIRNFIYWLPKHSLIEHVFSNPSRNKALHLIGVPRQTYSDYLHDFSLRQSRSTLL